MKAIITIMILFAVTFLCYAVRMHLSRGKTKSGVSEALKEDDKKKDKDKMEDGR